MRKTISILQMAGGMFGIIYMLLLNREILVNIGFLLALFIFSFSTICGYLLLKRNQFAADLSILNQFLQTINFSVAGVTYIYYCPITIELCVQEYQDFFFDFRLSARFAFSLLDTEFDKICFNLVPISFLIYLIKNRSTIEN